MTNDFMSLWSNVCKTDPADTKQAKKGMYSFTSIAPMSQIKKATEQWGSFGSGWGIQVGTEMFSNTPVGDTILINYDAVLFYPGGKLPIHACEKLAYKTQGANGYLKIDEEARKKVVTNALTKGLSMLGFNADIFMGMFEDYEYLEASKTEHAISKAEDKDAMIKEKQNELVSYIRSNQEGISRASTEHAARGILNVSLKHLERQRNILSLTEAADWGANLLNESYKKSAEGGWSGVVK